jgi:hypothetical protein
MKARSLKKLLAENPWLRGMIGTPETRFMLSGCPQKKALDLLCGWARKHLKYIAFRPFDETILSATTVVDHEDIALKDGSHTRGWTRTRCEVYAHIEGETARSRMKGTPWFVDDGPAVSVRDVIRSLADWSEEYWMPIEHKPLVIDMIIKITNQADEVNGLKSQAIEVFCVPDDFNPYSLQG